MYLDSSRNIVARNAHLLYESSNNCYLEVKRFNTNRKDLITRNAHIKYENPSIYCCKVINS